MITTGIYTAITPKILVRADVEDWIDANVAARGIDHVRRLARFWDEAEQGSRQIWVMWYGDIFLGHITVQPQSAYPAFKKAGIPEIVDLWVAEQAREQGVGARLLIKAIEYARENRSPAIGLGVGVTHDFGPAHCLYFKHGFRPDGTGLWVKGRQPSMGDKIALCEQALLMLVKPL